MLDYPDLLFPPKNTYKVNIQDCHVKVGDLVQPNTIVGIDFLTGDAMIADCHGQVEGLFVSRPEQAMIVVINPRRY